MPGLSDADKSKLIAECQSFMKTAQTETRKYDEVVKLAAADKDAAK